MAVRVSSRIDRSEESWPGDAASRQHAGRHRDRPSYGVDSPGRRGHRAGPPAGRADPSPAGRNTVPPAGGLTQAQRSDLTLTREHARRLEKTLRVLAKGPFPRSRPMPARRPLQRPRPGLCRTRHRTRQRSTDTGRLLRAQGQRYRPDPAGRPEPDPPRLPARRGGTGRQRHQLLVQVLPAPQILIEW